MTVTEKANIERRIAACGAMDRKGVYQSPISIDSVAGRMRDLTGENCRVWQCGPKETCIMGVVPGGGSLTSYVRDAAQAGCQLYITGEQSLYLIQYCMSIGINLIVGSHTFTELPGVRSLVERLQVRHSGLEIVQIEESHYESLLHQAFTGGFDGLSHRVASGGAS